MWQAICDNTMINLMINLQNHFVAIYTCRLTITYSHSSHNLRDIKRKFRNSSTNCDVRI